MADVTDILMASIEENWNQARHCEEQRATITNIILTVASLIHAALTISGFNNQTLPLTIFLMILGIYGFLATAKLYERNRYHVKGANALYIQLEHLMPDSQVTQTLASVKLEHEKSSRMSKIRLNHIWSVLHLLIAFLGFVYTFDILF
jgi:hypothetical protein